MPYVIADSPVAWRGTEFDQFMIKNYAERPNIWTLGRIKAVARGSVTARVPVYGSLTANTYVPGSGNEVTPQTASNSYKDIIINTHKEITAIGDKWEWMASSVEDQMILAKQIADGMMLDLDNKYKLMLSGYSDHDASHEISTAEGSEVANTSAAIAAETLRLITEAMILLDDETLGLGPNAGARFSLLDSLLYQHFAAGSDKQSPERMNQGFAIATGILNPVLGGPMINGGNLNRTAATYGEADITLIDFYVLVPEATALGVHQLPTFDPPEYHALLKGTVYSADSHYGSEDGNQRGYVKCTVRVLGLVGGVS